MAVFSMCHFCFEYRQCFQVVHQNGKEKFNMCFRCGLNYQGEEVWKEAAKLFEEERMKESV